MTDVPTLLADAAKVEALLQTPTAQAILAAVDAKLAAIPKVAALEAQITNVVPGWRTSEFWMTTAGQIGLILAAANGALPAKYAVVAGVLSQVAYTLSRGIVKKGNSN